MKKIFAGILLTLVSFQGISQDLIIRTNEDYIYCDILKTDSVNVYLQIIKADNKIDTHISLDKVKEIIYKKDLNKITQTPDSIFYIKESSGYSYHHKGKLIYYKNIKALLSLNPNAYKSLKKFKDNKMIGSVFAFAGGFMVGCTLGAIVSGKDPQWYLAGAGAFLIVLSIPTSIGARKNLHKAIDIYNSGLQKTSMIKKEIIFGFNNEGLGICFKF